MARVIRLYALPFWFASETLLGLIQAAQDRQHLFFDARLYLDATRTWLAGGDPWQVHIAGNYFAAPPPSLLFLAVVARLPEELGVALVVVAVAAVQIATIRLLRLPWWWLLFPPLVQCVLSANIHAFVVPLVLASGGAVAAIAKVYAVVPLVILGRWRSIVVASLIIIVTLPIVPWSQFIAEWPAISGHLQAQTKLGVPIPVLVLATPFVAASVAVVGRERGAWLAVSALWPSQQFYYGSIVLPARSQIAAALVALPVPGNGLLALFALTFLTIRARSTTRRPVMDRTFGADDPS